MKPNIRYTIVCALALLTGTATMAQTDSSTYNESVIIRGNFNPVISRFDKINVAPYITDTSTRLEHHFGYQLEPYRILSAYAPSRFKPVRLTGEPRTRLYHTYFRLGMGNYWSPLVDAYYNSTASHNLNYGIRLNHRSSWGSIGDKDKPETYYGSNHFSLTDVSLFGKKIINEKVQLYTDLSYQNDYNLLYGFNDTTLAHFGKERDDLVRAEYKAPYNLIAWNVGVSNIAPASHWVYDARLHLSDLMAGYKQNEFNLALEGRVGYRFHTNAVGDLLTALHLSFDGYSQNVAEGKRPLLHISDTLPTWQPDSSYTPHAARTLLTLNPYAEAMLAGIQVHAGLRVALDRYNEKSQMNSYLFPDVTLSRNFFDDALGVTLGAQGNDRAVSWNGVRLINPYITPCSEVRTTRSNDFFANVRYNFSKKLELDLHASYTLFKDQLSFVLDDDYLLGNVFRPKYETGSRLTVGGDFTFVNDEMITLALGGNYYHLVASDDDTLPFLYAAPFDLHFKADLNYKDRFLFHLNLMLLGKMDANYEYDATAAEFVITETVPLRYGLDLEFEYRHTKALSAFLRIDNLLFQRYYYWQNYPSQRALFTLGLTYTIPTKR